MRRLWRRRFNLSARFDVYCYTMLQSSEPGASHATKAAPANDANTRNNQ